MLVRLASHVVGFDMRGIPVVGNTTSGALVGLTSEGADLCDAMLEREVAWDEVPADCNRNRSVDPSFGDLRHAVDALSNLGVTRLVISGGEPFLRKDLPDIVRYARDRRMANITVLTNGTHCSDEVLAKLAGSVDVVSVSFDGASKESPSYIRGRAAVRGACRRRKTYPGGGHSRTYVAHIARAQHPRRPRLR